MIALNFTEAQITTKILRLVFGAELKPNQVFGLSPDQKTVVVNTTSGLYSIGKDYFKSLVQMFKAQQEENERGTGRVAPKRQAVAHKVSAKLNSFTWEVTGATGNRYTVNQSKTGQKRCNCKAAQFGRKCYHLDAVQAR